jgi:hypothetical protein
MKIKELREWLATLPPEIDDHDLILQIDPEGNGYQKVNGFDEDCIFYEGDGMVYATDWTAEEADMTEEEWEEFKKENKPCVVVYP